LGRFWTIARLNLFNLCVILALGSFAFFNFGAGAMIGAIACVYAVSAVIQFYLLRASIHFSSP
jgi:hypothetical protein